MKYKVGDVAKINEDSLEECGLANRLKATHIKITEVVDDYYYYGLLKNGERVGKCYGCFTDEHLEQVEKRLEYGYCDIGDILIDEYGQELTILDTRKILFDYSDPEDVDEHEGTLTYKEANVMGWKIKQVEVVEEMIEMTLEEVAKLRGVDVSKLRIKE